jgi:hypothetical protein
MTHEEQVEVCKAIALTHIWPQGGGIGTVILDELQKRFPMERPWRQVHDIHLQAALKEYRPREG